MKKVYAVLKLKEKIKAELNSTEIELKMENGVIGYIPVCSSLKEAHKIAMNNKYPIIELEIQGENK